MNVLLKSGYTPTCTYDFEFEGRLVKANKKSWRITKDGMENLIKKNRLYMPGNLPYYVGYYDDYPVQELSNHWDDTRRQMNGIYVFKTQFQAINRCISMVNDPGDLVLDITCRSGTTANSCEELGKGG